MGDRNGPEHAHGLTLNRPIKAFIIAEIKLAWPAFLHFVCRAGKALLFL